MPGGEKQTREKKKEFVASEFCSLVIYLVGSDNHTYIMTFIGKVR